MIILAEIALAVVAFHVPFSPEANKVEFWCPDGEKIEDPGGQIWKIDGEYEKVIVKAGAGEYGNTVYLRPEPGLGAYADTNGNFRFDSTGKGADKDISHVIVCPIKESSPSPSPTTASPSPTQSQTPSPTVTRTPEPAESQAPSPTTTKTNGPALAETGSKTVGAIALGLALIALGLGMTGYSKE